MAGFWITELVKIRFGNVGAKEEGFFSDGPKPADFLSNEPQAKLIINAHTLSVYGPFGVFPTTVIVQKG